MSEKRAGEIKARNQSTLLDGRVLRISYSHLFGPLFYRSPKFETTASRRLRNACALWPRISINHAQVEMKNLMLTWILK